MASTVDGYERASSWAAGWLVATRSRPSQPPVLHVARAQQPQRLHDDSPATLPLQWDLLAATDNIDFDSRVEDALQDIDCDTLQVGSVAQHSSKRSCRRPAASLCHTIICDQLLRTAILLSCLKCNSVM